MTPRPQMDSDSGNIKNSTTQECRGGVGFHGKCRRYQREFSSDVRVARRVCVLHLRTEKLTSTDEGGSFFV